jgi:YrbI family 3-deoxy-D-manno-octulosonate 8-phosphate phosphatase
MRKEKITKKDFKKIKLLVLDFDGVMTDNKVYVAKDGKETVCCSRADGMGIECLKKQKIKVMVLSKEKNRVVEARCKKLKLKSIQGIDDKVKILKRILKEEGLSPLRVCYLGNDINDIECGKFVYIGCAVRDSHPSLLRAADYVTKAAGGNGAVREVCDLILGV